MISRCNGDRRVMHSRIVLLRSFLSRTVSASSLGSAMVAAMTSSSCASEWRLSTESALWRAIVRSQVVTWHLASKVPACRQTLRNTSLTISCQGCVPGQAQHEAVDPHIVPLEEHLHGELVARG